MADEAAAEAGGEGGEAKGGGKGMLIGIAVAALLIGGGAGFFVTGPMVGKKLKPPVTVAAAEGHGEGEGEEAAAEGEDGAEADGEGEEGAAEEEHGGEEKKKEGEGGKHGSGSVFRIDNMVVNPAGSQGARFLMASIAFEVDAKAEEKLKTNELRVRDTVLAVLGAQRIDQLYEDGARERLKGELAAAIKPIAGKKAKVKVFLPQYVIQ